MKLAMIAAMAHDRVIGADNDMPWHLPADLKHFKAVTLGKPVVMGRRTYESIGRPLPGRPNIVVSSSTTTDFPESVIVVSSPEQALEVAQTLVGDEQEIMIIGGGKIYETFLPMAETLYLTHIDLQVAGDTRFPDYLAHAEWDEAESQQHIADEANPHNYRFVTLQRKR